MRLRMDYGRDGLEVDLPDANVVAVLGLSASLPLPEPEAAVAAALAAPIGAAPLAELAKGRRNACIVICDITRPVPNAQILPPILNTLHEQGIPREAITILIATGTHRPNEGEELNRLVGADIAAQYRIVNHRCKDLESHQFLGESPHGISVYLDRVYCEADLKITVGLIEPHFMAGYSGGRKVVMPGLAALETVRQWHCPKYLESPAATNGSIAGNPVHESALAIARMMPPDFIVNVVLDDRNAMTAVFAGHQEPAWEAGVQFAASHVRAISDRAADVVITSGAGYPLDATFYQTVKGIVGAMPAVKPGGTIIVVSECSEGIGSTDFQAALKLRPTLEGFMEAFSRPNADIPEGWQVEELARATRHADVVCVCSGVSPGDLAGCFVRPARTVSEALDYAMKKHGLQASIVAIPRGPYVIPCVQPTLIT